MRYAATILIALTVLGCAGEDAGQFPNDPAGQSPVDPAGQSPVDTAGQVPPNPAKTFVWGFVVDGTGVCIPGATVRVVLGQRAGETITQTTPCDAWAYAGGFVFEDLTVGVEMTLQASAPGYEVQEKRVVPSLGPQMAILFTPSRDK
jgi:hypothetical protein